MRPWPAALTIVALATTSGAARADPPAAIGGDPTVQPAVPVARPDPARIEEARRHMKAGASFYYDANGHKCEEALREFRTAFELSGSINALKGMAVCSLELERDGDAIEQYEAYLAGKGATIAPAERAQIEADVDTLRAAVARVTLSSDRAGVRITDVRTPAKGSPIRNTYTLSPSGTRLGVHPGQHVFTARTEGQPDRVWAVEIVNGGTYEHAFAFPDAAPDTIARPSYAPAYAVAGVTAALAVPWAVLAVRAKQKHDDYDALNGKGSRAELTVLRDQVKSANVLADVFLGATLVSLTVTGVLFFTRPGKPVAPKAGSFVIGPVIPPRGVGMAAVGWF